MMIISSRLDTAYITIRVIIWSRKVIHLFIDTPIEFPSSSSSSGNKINYTGVTLSISVVMIDYKSDVTQSIQSPFRIEFAIVALNPHYY